MPSTGELQDARRPASDEELSTAGADAEAYPHTIRLQRFLARAGVASRRGAEDLMTAGRVTVNGEVATQLGTKVTVGVDRVAVDGREVDFDASPVYLMLHKPAGYLTTMSDPQGRPCVASLVPRERYPGLFPVGRLDKDTTGLLLFTTDGELGNRLLHPAHHVSKRYIALVDGELSDEDLDALRAGIALDDGPCQPAPCRIIAAEDAARLWPDEPRARAEAGATCVEIILHEGRKNQVKRMFGAIHHPVLRLHRDRMGPLDLGELAVGTWRKLTHDEIAALRDATDTVSGATPADVTRKERA